MPKKITPTLITVDYDPTDRNEQIKNALVILKKTHKIASSFLKSYRSIHANRKTNRNQTEEQGDVLRAMFTFSASGLDSIAKQLIKDCLEIVVKKDEGARLQLKDFLKRKLKNSESNDFLSDLLSSDSASERAIQLLIEDLTKTSLQSGPQLVQVGQRFNINNSEFANDLTYLKEVFEARNQIMHEMDILSITSVRKRRGRSLEQMCEYTNTILKIAEDLIKAVEKRI